MNEIPLAWTALLRRLTCTVLRYNPHLLAVPSQARRDGAAIREEVTIPGSGVYGPSWGLGRTPTAPGAEG